MYRVLLEVPDFRVRHWSDDDVTHVEFACHSDRVHESDTVHLPEVIPQARGQRSTAEHTADAPAHMMQEEMVPPQGSSGVELCEGDLVCLHGLRLRPALNDSLASLLEYHAEKQRWSVETLLEPCEKLLIKPANMTVVRRWRDLLDSDSDEDYDGEDEEDGG